MSFKPRPKQAEVLRFQRGRMGVSAVPGSGKTRTLSALAARLIAEGGLRDDQEVLVVTLVNSAVGVFAQRVSGFLREEYHLLPNFGYRVRTLHGLANDIVRERPSLAGVGDAFTIIDEREGDDILADAARTWLNAHPDLHADYVIEDKIDDPRILSNQWPDLVRATAAAFIKQAKDLQMTPDHVARRLKRHSDRGGPDLPLAQMCLEIYTLYERGLRYRGAVDFQDLIRLALRVLSDERDYLARLRDRWPIILEDEAQDSSRLQEQILRALVGDDGRWVRVGDPNQAIYETFTTADPRHLRDFLREDGVQARELPNSGRSTASIIQLANALINFSLEHPNEAIRAKSPLTPPYIQPTPPGDPQGNPPDDPDGVYLIKQPFTPDEERAAVLDSLRRWLPEHPDATCAVLLPINSSGSKMAGALREAGIDYVENLRNTTATRKVIGTLTYIMRYLGNPLDAKALARVYRVWRRDEQDDADAGPEIAGISRKLSAIRNAEDFLYPRLHDWLDPVAADNEPLAAHLADFRGIVTRWLGAASLPVDQLVLTVAPDVFASESELATAYSAALYLKRFAVQQPDAYLPEYAAELEAIARNQRPFAGMSEEDAGFDPDAHRGKVTVTTMHKAKGLEWDRVYLMSVNNYTFPAGQADDQYISEKWFIRDQLNLEAEALAQLTALAGEDDYRPGQATRAARVDYAAERLRLLYVGITRARKQLVITYNTGRRGDQREALALAYLRGLWESS